MRFTARPGFRATIAAALLTVLTTGLAGCGSADPPPDEKAAVTSVVHDYVDNDNCAAMSDRYAAEGSADAAAGRKACEEDPNPGLQKGEYKLRTVEVTNRTAIANITMNEGGTREYTLVKVGDQWKIDGNTDAYDAKVGESLPYKESFTSDDVPQDPNMLVIVKQVKSPAPAPQYLPPAKGHKYVRVKITIKSRGKKTYGQSNSNFILIDTKGGRYNGNGATYHPGFGNETIELAPGDTVTGYMAYEIPKSSKPAEVRMTRVFENNAPLRWIVR